MNKYIKDRDRGMIFLLLDKIVESENKNLITILKAWEKSEYKKVKTKIQEVINVLEKVEEQPSSTGIILEGKCKKCGHEVARFIED